MLNNIVLFKIIVINIMIISDKGSGFVKIGVSIQDSVFRKKDLTLIANHNNLEAFLLELKSNGVQSIEIRKLIRNLDENVANSYNTAIQLMWDIGFEITIHGDVTGDFTGQHFAEVYPSMEYILNHFTKYQDSLTMTLHAYQEKNSETSSEILKKHTIELLGNWVKLVEKDNIPLYFGLENNRKKSNATDPGNSCAGAEEMVSNINNPHLGITWDMGHYFSNLSMYSNYESTKLGSNNIHLPKDSFLEKVYHTHIHGLSEAGRTHFPLTEEESLPLESYVSALNKFNYNGVLNLELSFERFTEEMNINNHLIASIERLKKLQYIDNLSKF